ncbi:MAG: transposase, partial [Alloacidobacterium sp.]
DIPVLLSLPGVGRLITATMLAEGAHILSLRDYHALRAHAGIAPVTKQSGATDSCFDSPRNPTYLSCSSGSVWKTRCNQNRLSATCKSASCSGDS